MPDRYVIPLSTALASNTGGPYTATWDSRVVPSTGTIRKVWAVATSITSNTRVNTVEVYVQPDAPAAGSNTGSTILVNPITLVNNRDAVEGTIRHSGARVTAGESLQLRTDSNNAGSQPSFLGLSATIEVERD